MGAVKTNIYRLKGTAGQLINQTFTLDSPVLQIGRAADCQVRIDQDSVAAHHAELKLEADGTVVLRDLGSPAGTRINGRQIVQLELNSGDEIQIGNTRLMLQAPGLKPARVLTPEATRMPARRWRWLLAASLMILAVLAWQQGWFSMLTAYFPF